MVGPTIGQLDSAVSDDRGRWKRLGTRVKLQCVFHEETLLRHC